MDLKDTLLNDVRHAIYNHDTLSSTCIEVKDGAAPREVVFNLVDCNKYTFRDEFVDGFETTQDGHRFVLVIECFTSGRVTAVFVDTTLYGQTVDAFLTEWRQSHAPIETLDAITLEHIEALEEWGAINRLEQLDAKHIHDAFIEYHKLSPSSGTQLLS